MPDVNPSRIPDNNLSNSSFIKNPGNKVKNPERFVDQEQEKKEREQAKFAAKNMALSQALANSKPEISPSAKACDKAIFLAANLACSRSFFSCS